jgi:lipopolysaccharide export system protein LptA
MRKSMNSKHIITKVWTDISQKQQLFSSNWSVFLGIILCLTTFHVLAAEAPDTENQDVEVVQEGEQTPENTEDNPSVISDQQVDETDTEQVEVTKEVITGTSDSMERYEKDGITILIGNAKTKRHTVEGDEIGFLNADTITIKTNPETGETSEIVAVGNVEIRDDKIFATCDHATMDNLTSIITLKNNVVVLQKNDRLETKLFTFNRVTGKQTGVGDVKFKVTVTQATPTASEESEGSDSDGTDSSITPDSSEDKVDSQETEKKDEKKSETDSDRTDSEEKTTPEETDKEKEESESKENSETEETESEENEQPESDDAGTEDTGEEESQE